MSTKVNLTKRVTLYGKDRYAPVVQANNGRIKSGWVVIDGKEVPYPGGKFYIDWTVDGKRKRKSAGDNASQAVAQQLRKETELRAQSQGISLVPQEELDKRRRLVVVVADYLDEIKLTKKPKTFQAYNTALTYFQESCSKVYLEEIDRMDMVRYSAFLRDKKHQSPRSVANKFENTMTFFKAQGFSGLVRKGDWPVYVEADVETYEKEELDVFFGACDETELVWFSFFLMTGMREQEVIYCTVKNVNIKENTVAMRWNQDYNWTPKGYKEREIPLPSKLIKLLKAWIPEGSPSRSLLFHTSSGGPKLDFLDCCKSIAKRAKLDPTNWWLHKFRATFATWHLRAGVDLRTVQEWMGHVDLESTLRYLQPARGAGVHAKVNATFE